MRRDTRRWMAAALVGAASAWTSPALAQEMDGVGAVDGAGSSGGAGFGDSFTGTLGAVAPVMADAVIPGGGALWNAGKAVAPQAWDAARNMAPHVQQMISGPQPGETWRPFPGIEMNGNHTRLTGSAIPLPPGLRERMDPRVNPELQLVQHPGLNGGPPRWVVQGSGNLGYGGGIEFMNHVAGQAGVQNQGQFDQVMQAAQRSLMQMPANQRRVDVAFQTQPGAGGPLVQSSMVNVGGVTRQDMERQVNGQNIGRMRMAPDGRMAMDVFGPTPVMETFANHMAANLGAKDRQVTYRNGIPVSAGLNQIRLDPYNQALALDIGGGGGMNVLGGYHGAGSNVTVNAHLNDLQNGNLPLSGGWQNYRVHTGGPVINWLADRKMDREDVTGQTDAGIRQALRQTEAQLNQNPAIGNADIWSRGRTIGGNIALAPDALQQGLHIDGVQMVPPGQGGRSVTRFNASMDRDVMRQQAMQGLGQKLFP